jgi:hypothetical protein
MHIVGSKWVWVGSVLILGVLSWALINRENTSQNKAQLASLPSPEAVRGSLLDVKREVDHEVAKYRELRQRLENLPDDLIGLPQFKEQVGSSESILGALAGRTTWLVRDLESVMRENKPETIESFHAHITSIRGDLTFTNQALTNAFHDLIVFEQDAARQTSWSFKLSSGYEVKAAPGGLERGLIEFASSAKKETPSASWHRFDRLYFVDIRTSLRMDKSEAQLGQVVEILKSYPKLQLDLSAFGIEAQRRQDVRARTLARIEVLREELLRRGIAADRVRIERDGPACPIDAPERCVGSLAARPNRK